MSERRSNMKNTVVFRALGNDSRIAIVDFLMDGPKGVQEIAIHLGLDIVSRYPISNDQPYLSNNLRILRTAGLVEVDRKGKFSTYRLNPDLFKNGHLDLGWCHLVPKKAAKCK